MYVKPDQLKNLVIAECNEHVFFDEIKVCELCICFISVVLLV